MPIYGFECEVCKHEHETIVSYSKRHEPQTCPKCGNAAHYVDIQTGLSFTVKGAGAYTNKHDVKSNKGRKK